LAKFGEVLKNRNFFFLWLSQIISQFGDRLNQMALIALVYARAPGSTSQLAKVFAFTILPVFLIGPVAASYVDRWNRRRTMFTCDLLRALLVASVALFFIRLESLWPIYIIVFIVFSLGRFFVPAKMAIIPGLVSKEKLLLANSLSSTTGMIAAVAGFGLGGLLVEAVGSKGGFLLDALTYLISGLFIFMIVAKAVSSFGKGKQQVDPPAPLRKNIFVEIKEGWQYLFRDKDTRFVAQMLFLLWSAIGAVYIVVIVFVQRSLGSVTSDLGVLAMTLGTGLFCGSLICGRFGQRFSKIKIIFISMGASGFALTSFAIFLKLFPSRLVSALLSFLLGLLLAPAVISAQTLIHEVTDDKMRGRIFGSLEIVAHLAFLIFMFLSSFLAERIGRFWILSSVGAVLTIVGFGAIVFRIDKGKLNAA
jgi:MFS family permease